MKFINLSLQKTIAISTIFNISSVFAQYEEDFYVDQEDYEQSQQWSHFEFNSIEIGMMILGIILLAYIIPKIKDERDPGCLLIGALLFGIICLAPAISGILTLIGRIVGEIVKLAMYVALVAGGIYLISSFFKKE
ncbi:MAG: hypothetical protein ACK5AR_00180 [Flavobacteriia bacterium]|jgi:hypothetical protein